MPETFDPTWEYWEPDPEVAEVLALAASLHSLDDFALLGQESLRLERIGLRCGFGFRFGRGNPNRPHLHLGRPKSEGRRESYCRFIPCVWCGNHFTERRPNCGGYCSCWCAGQARGLDLRKRPLSLECRVCDRRFEPLYGGQTLCSRACAGLLGAEKSRVVRVGDGCPTCGLPVVKSGRGNSKAKVYCSRRCLKVAVNRAYRVRIKAG